MNEWIKVALVIGSGAGMMLWLYLRMCASEKKWHNHWHQLAEEGEGSMR